MGRHLCGDEIILNAANQSWVFRFFTTNASFKEYPNIFTVLMLNSCVQVQFSMLVLKAIVSFKFKGTLVILMN